ncbi:MAG: glycosyltransferase family 2 protein, partial [Nocardioides sp.]|uniref:glycosyltransferase family 2 protein n=1 Tax=Nocardioides sp. TaxID=35761 RepID=UPI003F04EFCA
MIVTAILVSHDGARWLPAVLDGLLGQTRPVDRVVAIDTTSRDGSDELLRQRLGDSVVHVLPGDTSYPDAVDHALDLAPGVEDEWVWLLHDDSNPAPDALEQLVYATEEFPEADVIGPKLREWPSLRRLLEVGLTVSGTGHRETGLERGEYDQGQHDEIRTVLAVNTAGMLVRRRVLHELGGFDPSLPIFGNDVDFGWRAAQAGHSTIVVPTAVVFHAEAAHRGTRRTPLTGRHTHYQERRAALLTVLANVPRRALAWQYVRLFLGSLLRAVGFLVVRSVGEALDEVAAVLSVHGRPGQIRAARRFRSQRRSGEPVDVSGLLAPWWLPYRHGLDFLTDLFSALTSQAADVAERRRAAKAGPVAPVRSAARTEEEEEDEYLTDSGVVVRFLTNPVAVVMTLVVIACLVAAREALGAVVGGALSPVPEAAADWWRLHLESWHPLG